LVTILLLLCGSLQSTLAYPSLQSTQVAGEPPSRRAMARAANCGEPHVRNSRPVDIYCGKAHDVLRS
jgi:hypothetical protein